MKRFLFVIPLIPLCISCIWDRDTLADDGEGRLDAAKTIVGWFDRNPPEYYEIRLNRVIKELESQPDNLELYDDAAVALDRLRRSSEAIDLIEKKKQAIDRLRGRVEDDIIWEHQYRYLANIGTFYAHRWIGKNKSERKTDLTDLKTAETFIEQAIKHNPDAHFGREHFQLKILKWLQLNRGYLDESNYPIPSYPSGSRTQNKKVDPESDSKVTGLLGMVQLGAAWESIDIYRNIAHLLQAEGRNALSYAAILRVSELKTSEKASLHPLIPTEDYSEQDRPRFIENDIKSQVDDWYLEARKAADLRHANRLSYMQVRFQRGEHPDTHADFWNDWNEPKFPPLPGVPLSSYFTTPKVFFTATALVVFLAILLWIRSFIKRR